MSTIYAYHWRNTMNVVTTDLPGVLIIEPKVFGDERGFSTSFNAKAFEEATGLNTQFVQDNHSRSQKGVLRGLHYQLQNTQGKLVRVTCRGSARCRRGHAPQLAAFRQMGRGAPVGRQPSPAVDSEGFAHGFVVMSESPNSSTRPPTTTTHRPSAAFAGTTPTWPSTGNWKRRNCRPRIKGRRDCPLR
jgi:dTDP-4-dehydrorhamnose 3,5-epimerase